MTRLIANFEESLQPIIIELNATRKLDNSKAREILGWEPISPREAVLATAESVIEHELV